MRQARLAIARALADDAAVSELVSEASIYAVERATLPVTPCIEVIGIRSEASDYLAKHEASIEVTVTHATPVGADELLAAIVSAVRGRLLHAQSTTGPIALPSGARLSVEVGDTRWSVSVAGKGGVNRGAAVAVTVTSGE